ncbi:MAG: GerAB/ArcD/ProY family transporter [Clostridia bacterium]|nr:GerAB/ArcD/ProY family transporter [Clostridia bacterium]
MKETLSVRQTALLCSIMIFTSKLLILPSLFFHENKYGGFLCVVVVFIIELSILYFFIKLKEKYNNISLYDLLSSYLPKLIVKIIFIALLIFFSMKLLYILQENYHFLKVKLYSGRTTVTYLFCVIPVINALAYKGLKAYGRSLEIFYYIILIGLLFCALSWFSSLTSFGFNLYVNNGITGFFNGLYKFSFWFCDFLFFIMIIDKIKIENDYGKKIMRISIFSVMLYLLILFSFYYIYQSTSFFHAGAKMDILHFSSKIGFVGKLDLFAFGTGIFLLYFQGGIYLYCAKECYNKVLNLKNDTQAIIFINVIILLLFYFVFQNMDNSIFYFKEYLSHLAFVLGYGLPLLLLYRYLFNKETSKKSSPYNKKIYDNINVK